MARERETLVPIDWIEDTAPQEVQTWTNSLRLLALAAGVLALLAAIILGLAASTAYLDIPFSDAHDWIARVFVVERTHNWIGYVWEPHTNQRIPLVRLVEAFDVDVARGHWPSFLLARAFTWLLGVGALAYLLLRSRLALSIKVGIGCLAAALAANIGLAEDFAFPVFSVYLFVTGPALAAFVTFQFSRTGPWRSPAFWAALAFGLLASGGNAAGLAVWPTLLVCALLQRRDVKQIGALVIVALTCGVLVEWGLGVPSTSLVAAGGAAHIGKMVVYFATLGGLPWSRAFHPMLLEAAFGLCVWTGSVWALRDVQFWREDGAATVTQAGAAMIIFGLITALLATFGRVDELPDPIVPTRYTPFATILQLGVLLALSRWLEGLVGRGRQLAIAVLFGLAALVLSAAPHGMRGVNRSAAKIRAASAIFDKTGEQPGLKLHPRPEFAAAVRAQLQQRGLPY